MHVKLQLVLCSDDGQEKIITDLVTLQKDSQRIEHLGLTLREAKQLLNTVQQRLLQHQVDAVSRRVLQPARTATHPSKPKARIPARSAPCLAPSNSQSASLPVSLSTAYDHYVSADDVSAS